MQLRNNPLDLDMDLDLRAGRSVSDCLKEWHMGQFVWK